MTATGDRPSPGPAATVQLPASGAGSARCSAGRGCLRGRRRRPPRLAGVGVDVAGRVGATVSVIGAALLAGPWRGCRRRGRCPAGPATASLCGSALARCGRAGVLHPAAGGAGAVRRGTAAGLHARYAARRRGRPFAAGRVGVVWAPPSSRWPGPTSGAAAVAARGLAPLSGRSLFAVARTGSRRVVAVWLRPDRWTGARGRHPGRPGPIRPARALARWRATRRPSSGGAVAAREKVMIAMNMMTR